MRSTITQAVDSCLERFARLSTQFQLRDPIRSRLADHRKSALREVAEWAIPGAEALAEGVKERNGRAIAEFDLLAARAIDGMRATRPPGRAFLGAIDRALYADHPEILDDPSFSEAQRKHVLNRLDRLNDVLGSYDSFVAATVPLVERARADGNAPVILHDLASGHGGFALALKERLGADVRVVASDIRDEYLQLGRERARARGLSVEFELLDALALGARDLEAHVFTCTQSLHHFPPGMVARMLGEAARAARTGVVFIDGERSWASMAVVAPFALLYGRSYAFVHDTVASLRRMYFEEELALIASLAPGLPPRARIETGTIAPAHLFVRIHLEPAR